MELQDYTDEQLREELKRRAKEKRAATRKERGTGTDYAYAMATITWMSEGPFIRRQYEATLTDEEWERLKVNINHKTFQIRSMSGFNKSTAPKVGDLVLLKGRRSRHDKTGFFWGNVYLDKILKSAVNETSEA